MDKQIQKIKMEPDYVRIYTDIIKMYPNKRDICQSLINRKKLSALDVLKLNQLIFGRNNKETENFNQQHRNFQKSDITQILDYQKKYNLNNTQLAKYYKLSRNTIAKWKKIF